MAPCTRSRRRAPASTKIIDKLLSSVASNCNSRPYIKEVPWILVYHVTPRRRLRRRRTFPTLKECVSDAYAPRVYFAAWLPTRYESFTRRAARGLLPARSSPLAARRSPPPRPPRPEPLPKRVSVRTSAWPSIHGCRV